MMRVKDEDGRGFKNPTGGFQLTRRKTVSSKPVHLSIIRPFPPSRSIVIYQPLRDFIQKISLKKLFLLMSFV